MIDLHYWPTPNGHKITLFLEETGLPYRIVPVDIGRGEQFRPEFLAIAPNNRMPAIVDHAPADGGAPVQPVRVGCDPALPRRQDRPLHPGRPARPRRGAAVAVLADGRARARWPGRTTTSRSTRPRSCPTPSTATSTRPTGSTACWTGASPTAPFVAGDDYSIADMAAYPWIVPYERQGQKLDDFPNLERWFRAIEARPGHRPRLRGRPAAPAPRGHHGRGGQAGHVRPDGGQLRR